MKILTTAVFLFWTASAFASVVFTQNEDGGLLEWDAVEGDYESLVIRAGDTVYDPDDDARWGALVVTVKPDEDGIFPDSVQLSPSYIVDKSKCIADGLCVEACPTGAISVDADGKAVIDPNKCIACAICVSVCPVNAIFTPDEDMFYALFGVDCEGGEVFLQGGVVE